MKLTSKQFVYLLLALLVILCIAAVSTTSVMVNSSTKALVNPTNFFVANSNLLNQAIPALNNVSTNTVGGLTLTGGIYLTATTNIGANYTVLSNDFLIKITNDSALTITLTNASLTNRHWFTIKAYSTNIGTVFVITNAIGNIDSLTNAIYLSNFASVTFHGDVNGLDAIAE